MDYSGRTLDNKYQVVSILGRGGMGAVYKGVHKAIGKSVAIKFLHAEFAGNTEVVKRFYREAQAAAAIGHSNIIDVMDVGVSPEGEPYLVMEYLEGESLSAMLRRVGPVPVDAACGILEPALLALHAAHAKGIVHRDLKPENIFLVHREGEPPKVKLIDFGISKFVGASGNDKLTQTGSVMGTPSYMSPEQARGDRNLDHRSDLYAMGVIFYEMLTARLPFTGENYTQIIINILTAPPLPPREAYSGFPVHAESVLLRSLEKDPQRRYQNALEFLEALKGIEGFGNRQDGLTMVAAGITHKTFAGGDLGSPSSTSGPSVAADVLSEVMGTPTGWAGTTGGLATKRRSRAPLAIGLGVGAFLTVAAAAIAIWAVVWAPRREPAALPASPVIASAGAQESVQIAVEGAPPGATFKFGDKVFSGNPFAVPKDTAIVSLEVSAAGFAPAKTFVVPSENRVVRLELKPLAMGLPAVQPEPEKEGSSSSRDRSRRDKRNSESSASSSSSSSGSASATLHPAVMAPTTPASTPEPAAEPSPPKEEPRKQEKEKKMVDGARGTKIRTSFE